MAKERKNPPGRPRLRWIDEYTMDNNAVCTITRLQAGQPRNRGSIPNKTNRILVVQIAQTGSGAHAILFFFHWLQSILSPAVDRLEHDADHRLSCSVEVKNEWSHTSTILYTVMF